MKFKLSLVLLFQFSTAVLRAQVIVTTGGTESTSLGGVGKLAIQAGIGYPSTCAVDASANIYFETGNRIMRIDANTGVLTTFAGTGQLGSTTEGAALSAKLWEPSEITTDGFGNIYFLDQADQVIKRVTSTGWMQTIYVKGTVNLNLTNVLSDLVSDPAGNLFFTDMVDNKVYKRSTAGVISVIAGTGVPGNNGDNIAATSAQLEAPLGIARNANDIYIIDLFRIRKINNATGIITTVAGTGTSGFSGDGGPATAAQLNSPQSIDVDAAGNLYILEQGNRVRKVDQGGVISTYVGTGTAGFSGDYGPPENAQLKYPKCIAVSSAHGLFIADGSRIRSVLPCVSSLVPPDINYQNVCQNSTNFSFGVSASGIGPFSFQWYENGLTAISGETNANFSPPTTTPGVVNSYVVKMASSCGTVFFSTGYARTFGLPVILTQPSTSSQTVAQYTTPVGLTAQADYCVATFQWYRNTTNSSVGGTPVGTPEIGCSTTFRPPTDVPGSSWYYVTASYCGVTTSTLSGAIIVTPFSMDQNSHIITSIAGTGTASFGGDNGTARLAGIRPSDVVVDANGNLFIADKDNHRIRKVDAISQVITTIAGTGTAGYSGDGSAAISATLNSPSAIELDDAGNIYIADYNNHRIRKIDRTTGIINTIAGNGVGGLGTDGVMATTSSLHYPTDCILDRGGNLLIVEKFSNRLRSVSATTQVISTVAGTGAAGYLGDGGPAGSARLFYPTSVQINSVGDIYISDTENNRIRKIDAATGIITTIAGTGVSGFGGDEGPASTARLNKPTGLAIDINGNLYISDKENNRIREINIVSGLIKTIAGGSSSVPILGDGGSATGSKLTSPEGINIDSQGNLTISDYGNNKIRKVWSCIYSATPPPLSPNQTPQQVWCQDVNPTTAIDGAASPGSLKYQWYSNLDNANVGGIAITDAEYEGVLPSTATPGITYYYASVTGHCGTAFTNVAAKVTINPKTAITVQPSKASQTLCEGTTATPLVVTAIGTPSPGSSSISYQWYRSSTNSIPTEYLYSYAIEGANASTYTPNLSNTKYYFAKVGSQCGQDVFSVISGPITIYPPTRFTPPSTAPQTISTESPGQLLTTSIQGSGLPVSYRWFVNTSNTNIGGSAISGATGSHVNLCSGCGVNTSYTPATSVAGTYYYYLEATTSCGTFATSPSGPITVLPTIAGFSPSKGPAGTTVTISGSSFSSIPANNIVNFNGALATAATASNTVIDVVVPSGATSGPIGLTSNGISRTSSSNFVKTNPSITSLSSGIYGSSIELSVEKGGSTGSLSYSVTNGTGSATLNGNLLTPTGAGTVTVTANIAADGPYPPITLSQVVTIQKAPQTISFSLPDLCPSGTYPLQATSTSGLPITYTSSNPSKAYISGNNLITIGTGSVSITASQPGNNNYEPASNVRIDEYVAKINQTVTLQPIPDKTYGDAPFVLQGSATSGLPVSYTYDADEISVSNGVATILRAGSVSIEATQAGNGCYNSNSSSTEYFRIEKAEPIITISASQNDFCFGAQPVITFSSTSNHAPVYLFNANANPEIVLSGNTISFSQPKHYYFMLKQEGDDNHQEASSSYYTFDVRETPTGTIYTNSSTTLWPGQSSLLQKSGNADAYRWVKDGNDIQGATGSNYSASASGTYSLRFTKNYQNVTCSSASNDITVDVLDAMDVTISPNPANQEFTVLFPTPLSFSVSIKVTTSTGSQKYTGSLSSGQTSKTISCGSWTAGLHYVTLTYQSNTIQKSIMITH